MGEGAYIIKLGGFEDKKEKLQESANPIMLNL